MTDRKKHRDDSKYWPVSTNLLAEYRDGSHTETHDGHLYWRNKNGELHRDGDKPAVIYAYGYLGWFQNGERHRSCGPAVIRSDGRNEWWINGQYIDDLVYDWLAGAEWQGTPEQIVEFQLRFT